MTDMHLPVLPYAIAHRGASAYAPGNTLAAFRKADILGADMWEVDIRATSDGVPVVFHDAELADGQALNGLSRGELQELLPNCPDLAEVIALAAELGAGIYADIKDVDAALATLHLLQNAKISPVIIGAFKPQIVQTLQEAGSVYPVAGLVPIGVNPHVHAAQADIIHLCWEHMQRPQDELTPEFFSRAFGDGKRVVIWHEEDPIRMAEIRTKPVTGICSDMPQLVNPFKAPRSYPFGIVCHRGSYPIAPENTLPGLECALAGGFDYIEVDLQITSDGEIVVFHDAMLDRTTDGIGPVCDHTLAQLRKLDAGVKFDPFFASTRIPTLKEVLELLNLYNGRAYLEFKSAPPAPVLELVRNAGLLDRVFFWSFNREFLMELRAMCPEAQIMTRRQDYPSVAEAIADYAANLVEFLPNDDPAEIASLRGSKVQSMVAYMGDDEAVFGQIVKLHPDLFNLNSAFAFSRFSKSI